MEYSREIIARVCHEAVRAFCQVRGDDSLEPWEAAPAWQRDSSLQAVDDGLAGRVTTPRQSHEAWVRVKEADGWVLGEVKDAARKTHPSLIPFDRLPADERIKDSLICAVIGAFREGRSVG